MIGAISNNISSVKNALESEDVLSTIQCLKKLGVKIKKQKRGCYLIYGKGLGSLSAKKHHFKLWKLCTLARLLIGILSSNPNINVNIKGDRSLNRRNMKKLIELMSEFGAFFTEE